MKITVLIPCYKVKKHILDVLGNIGDEVDTIIVIDDDCPEQTGEHVRNNYQDDRLKIIKLEKNIGVGGAIMAGLRDALEGDGDVFVKIDGDGQMNPSQIKTLIQPIIDGKADYTKGNRFYHLTELKMMPISRLIGNATLSIITKFSSGYWKISDPTNGFTALHRKAALMLSLDMISKRYFFESDMLYHLNQARAVVKDIPIPANYADEKSNLKIKIVLFEFAIKNLFNFTRRIFFTYFIREFSVASLQFFIGSLLFLFGFVFGLRSWYVNFQEGSVASAGTVMIAALPILLGFQLLMAFTARDIESEPELPLQQQK